MALIRLITSESGGELDGAAELKPLEWSGSTYLPRKCPTGHAPSAVVHFLRGLANAKTPVKNLHTTPTNFTISLDQKGPLPGFQKRASLCRNCDGLTVGLEAAFQHAKQCYPNKQMTAWNMATDGRYIRTIQGHKHLPNRHVLCPVKKCPAKCCSVQGLIVHLALNHGYLIPYQQDDLIEEARAPEITEIALELKHRASTSPAEQDAPEESLGQPEPKRARRWEPLDVPPPKTVICLGNGEESSCPKKPPAVSSLPSEGGGAKPADEDEKVIPDREPLDEDDDDVLVIEAPVRPVAARPLRPAPSGDDELQEVEADGKRVSHRKKEFNCSVCSKSFCTEGSRDRHSLNDHKMDISQHSRLCDNVYGVPLNGPAYFCPTCMAAFKDQQQHQQHMDNHLKMKSSLYLCDYCSGFAISPGELDRHNGEKGHVLDSKGHPVSDVKTEIWCTMCKDPYLVFLEDSSYYLHIQEHHKTPIFFFCNNCLMGSCDYKVTVEHISSGTCVVPRIYRRTFGFVAATELHYQPLDEAEYRTRDPLQMVKAFSCMSRTNVRSGASFASCENRDPIHGEVCLVIAHISGFKYRRAQELNLLAEEEEECLPVPKYVDIEWNLLNWVRQQEGLCLLPPFLVMDQKPHVRLTRLRRQRKPNPRPAIGREQKVQQPSTSRQVKADASDNPDVVTERSSSSQQARERQPSASTSRRQERTAPRSRGRPPQAEKQRTHHRQAK